MNPDALKEYSTKTAWRGPNLVPTEKELNKMEGDCVMYLYNLHNDDFKKYVVVYCDFFELILYRLSVAIKAINRRDLSQSEDIAIKRVLTSLNEMISKMRRPPMRLDFASGEIKGTIIKKQSQPMKGSSSKRVPHFTNLNIDEETAAYLYDRLVKDGYLEDRSKEDFVFYYTGKGRKPKGLLKWRGEEILLSVLTEHLLPRGGKISWKTLGKIYEDINTDSMKNVYSKTKKGLVVYTYEKHLNTVEKWLTKDV